MSTPHKYADVIKHWAYGGQVEFKSSEQAPWKVFDQKHYSMYVPEFNSQYLQWRIYDKFRELKEAHKNGAVIEYFNRGDEKWYFISTPKWDSELQYRIQPHKWQHLIDAQAAGKKVQGRVIGEPGWQDNHWVFDGKDMEYRLKPEGVKYRLFWWNCATAPTRNPVLSFVTWKEEREQPRGEWSGFIRWEGDWQTVEIPE